MSRSIADAIREATQVLNSAGVPEARREAGSLLSFVLGKDRTFLISHADDAINEDSLDQFEEIVDVEQMGNRSNISPAFKIFSDVRFA